MVTPKKSVTSLPPLAWTSGIITNMWQEKDKALVKEFAFPDFKSALIFVDQVGAIAEAANHHPDIQLSYGKVVISLSTHSEGGITDKDRALAKEIDNVKS